MNDDYFNSFSTVNEISHECIIQVESSKSETINQFVIENNLNECVTRSIKTDDKLGDFIMKKLTIESIQHGWLKSAWNAISRKKAKALESVKNEIYIIISNFKRICKESEFGDIFNSFFHDDREFSKYSSKEELCIRRIVLENESTEEFGECNDFLTRLENELFENIKDSNTNFAKCKASKLKSEKYFELLMQIEMLTKFDLNHDQMEKEKVKFVQKMMIINDKINQCS